VANQRTLFQAQKFVGTECEDEARKASTAMVATHIGRSRQRPLRSDWDSVKDQIMLEAVRAKFRQHDDVKAILGTGGAPATPSLSSTPRTTRTREMAAMVPVKTAWPDSNAGAR
jgi:hypothetical protein